MITVRIPNEIRAYKEKLVAGLNARQLISTILALAICVPLYFYGKKYLPEDVMAWAIILIAFPLAGIGFVKVNGLPMEKFAVAIFKWFVPPGKRKYKTSNVFRQNNDEAKKMEQPISSRDRKKLAEYEKAAAMEKIVLMLEAEERGELEVYNVDDQDLLTVSKPAVKYPVDEFALREELVSKDSTLQMSRSQRQIIIQGEAIQRKLDSNPTYVMTPVEHKTMTKYRALIDTLRKKQLAQKKKEASKRNQIMKKRRSARYTIPKSTADSIPIVATYDEGMFEVAPNKYAKQYRIRDINYRIAKQESQEAIFVKLCELYNYFNETMHFSFHIDNRIVSLEEQEKQILYPATGDSYDCHRQEYNRILRRQLETGRNDVQLQKFLTITIDANEPMEALLRFRRIDSEISALFGKIGSEEGAKNVGSEAKVMTTTERLAYFHDKFRAGHEGEFRIDYDFLKQQGLSCRDYIAPQSFDFSHAKYFQMGEKFCRVLYLSSLPTTLSDEFLFELYNFEFPLTIAMNVQAVDPERGMRIVKKQLTGIEMNKNQAEEKAAAKMRSPESIRRDIKDAYRQAEQLYDDMLNKDQKMFFVTFTILVHGDTLDELNQNVAAIESKAAAYTCQIMSLPYQQEEGMKVTLPFGYVSKDLAIDRTLTTESSAIFMPFSNQEMFQPGGFYYGMNPISHNLVVIDRLKMKTPSGFVLGTSGSGKSFATKREILNVLLHDNKTNVIIIDPENEYADFCRLFGGTVIKISSDSTSFINPLDMDEDYGLDEDDIEKRESIPIEVKMDKALKKKSDFVMSIIERMISVGGGADQTVITPVQKTIVDRCVKRCYESYLAHNFDQNYLPSLMDLQNEFDREKQREIQEGAPGEAAAIADSVEYYTRGSMNIFAHKTNIDMSNRVIVFNVRDLGEQLRQIALTIVFDFIWNRMVSNKQKNVRTYCYADEIHVMFASYFSSEFLKQLYKRGRKYGLCITGITQNVSELIQSEQARSMIGNSDYIMMLNQKSADMDILAAMLNVSDSQRRFVTAADEGCGLIFAEKVIIPFEDKFPSDSYLYSLMSTKFGEDLSSQQVDELMRQIMQSA